ncbi:MAG: hypothetical protein MK538_05470 [Planctomycetes bacterium]|nr:hypothetical protein [Planctomycetota bacterium]
MIESRECTSLSSKPASQYQYLRVSWIEDLQRDPLVKSDVTRFEHTPRTTEAAAADDLVTTNPRLGGQTKLLP